MKNLILILFSAILLTSCGEISDKNNSHTNTFRSDGGNSQLDEIRKDINVKYNSLSFDQKLGLCVQSYSLEYPDRYSYIMKDRTVEMREALLNDPDFIRICESRKVNPRDIPDTYFKRVEKKTEFEPVYLTVNNKTGEMKMISAKEYLEKNMSEDNNLEIIRTVYGVKN